MNIYESFPIFFYEVDKSTGGLSSRLEKKQTINSWKRHALCDWILSYEKNRGKEKIDRLPKSLPRPFSVWSSWA